MEEEMKKREKLPPGFRFHPTDEELITYYLKNKISDSSFTGIAITDVDLNRCEPWDLPGKAKMGEKEWYFFNLRDRKYPTGLRTNRATNAGYWKTTGKDKEIFNSSSSSELVGMKKTLVFYKGRAPRGEKTNWVIHEYRNQFKSTFKNSKDEWVVCRVFQKSFDGKKYPSNQPKSTPFNIYNHNSHQMVGSSSTVTPHQNHDPYYNGVGRNYYNNSIPNTMTTTMMMNLNQVQQHGFSVSGLDLNLGAVVPRPVLVQPQFNTGVAPPQAPVIMASSSSGCADADFIQCGIHHTTDNDHVIGNNNCGSTFQTMEPCLELEAYWPNYY